MVYFQQQRENFASTDLLSYFFFYSNRVQLKMVEFHYFLENLVGTSQTKLFEAQNAQAVLYKKQQLRHGREPVHKHNS